MKNIRVYYVDGLGTRECNHKWEFSWYHWNFKFRRPGSRPLIWCVRCNGSKILKDD